MAKLPKVCRDFIVVRPDVDTVSKGGIIIADNAKDPHNPVSGTVIGVGSGLVEGGHIIPLVVNIGDHVHFPRNAGTLCEKNEDWNGETVFVLRENQVFWAV